MEWPSANISPLLSPAAPFFWNILISSIYYTVFLNRCRHRNRCRNRKQEGK